MDLLLPLNALALGLTFSASYCVFVLYVRYQRLAHIPGPFLAAFTDLWRARIQFFGPIVPTLHQLHEKYGPVVRIGPNTVSLSNPAHIPIVGSPRGGFAKVRMMHLYGTQPPLLTANRPTHTAHYVSS